MRNWKVFLLIVYCLLFIDDYSIGSSVYAKKEGHASISTINYQLSTINRILPQADDTFWRDSIPQEMHQSYVQYGEQYLGKSWTVLPWTVFAENKQTGNRVNYEARCFEKRRQLAAIVMAEIMEGKGRFIGDIIDGIGSFCEETWWGIPAHYSKAVPLPELQEVDLFNA